MNWTGGRLQRHSAPARGHGDLIHRQRLHFARARTQIYHGQPNAPILEPGPSTFFYSSPANAHHSRPLIKRHQHETAATLAHHQSSAKRPTRAHYKASKARKTAHVAGDGHQRNGDERTYRRLEPPGNMSFDSSARLKAKKAQLLESRDWVGLASSRPLHLAFASGKEKRAIGKRHKVKRQKRFRYEGTKFLETTSKQAQEIKDDGPYMSGAILDDHDIRIRIGTDAMATQSLVGNNDSPGMNAPLDPSSDEMLFDVEARREMLQSEDGVFWGHNVESCSSKDEQANVQCAAGSCEAERSLANVQLNDSDAPLADVDKLLLQLEETPSRFPIQHECGSSAAHALGSVHASPHELEKDNVNDRRMQDVNVTMQSPEYQPLGKSHSAFQAHGQGISDSVAIRGTLLPRSVHLAGTLTPYDEGGSKAALLEENTEMRPRSSTAQPLLHETNGNTEPAHLLDDIAWKKFLHVNSDMADQSLDMQRSHCENQGAHGGIQSSNTTREIDESSHVHSGDIPTFTKSAAGPIGDGRHMHSGDLKQEDNPTVRNVEGAAADGADRARSRILQMPMSSAVAAAAKTGLPAATSAQIDGFAKSATLRWRMILDAEVDAAETIWKRFVLGSDVCEAQCKVCKSPERALRSTAASTRASQNGSFSSLSVQASPAYERASAPFQPLEACSHGTVDKHHERAERAAARESVKDSTDQSPTSMAVGRPGNTTADSLSINSWPDTLDDAEDAGSSNVDLQSVQAVASDSTGHLPGDGKRITFSKPKPFAGSTAASAPGSVKAGQENAAKGSAPRIGPLRIQRNRR